MHREAAPSRPLVAPGGLRIGNLMTGAGPVNQPSMEAAQKLSQSLGLAIPR